MREGSGLWFELNVYQRRDLIGSPITGRDPEVYPSFRYRSPLPVMIPPSVKTLWQMFPVAGEQIAPGNRTRALGSLIPT
jgi:hypothetical protein